MNKDDKNRHFVLLIIDISKHGAKEMGYVKMAISLYTCFGIRIFPHISRCALHLTRIILRPLTALSLDECSDQRERNITTGLFGLPYTSKYEEIS